MRDNSLSACASTVLVRRTPWRHRRSTSPREQLVCRARASRRAKPSSSTRKDTMRDLRFLAATCSPGTAVTWPSSNGRGAPRRPAPTHAILRASSSKEPCAPSSPKSRRWARLPRPPFPALSRLRFCHLAKRFPESAFPRVLIPVTRDPVSCDSPYLPDSHRNPRFSIPTASTPAPWSRPRYGVF